MGIDVKIFRAVVFLLCLSVPSVYAEMTYAHYDYTLPPQVTDKLNKTITLDLRGIQVLDVLKYISEKTGINIVASQKIDARVNLFLKDVSVGNAFEIILLSTGL